jgi:hypothetical protein
LLMFSLFFLLHHKVEKSCSFVLVSIHKALEVLSVVLISEEVVDQL